MHGHEMMPLGTIQGILVLLALLQQSSPEDMLEFAAPIGARHLQCPSLLWNLLQRLLVLQLARLQCQ